MNTAYIDNDPFEIVEGETMLAFIRRYKSQKLVPTLCDAPNLDPFGSCRVCSVEVAMEKIREIENGSILPYTSSGRTIYLYKF